MVVKKMNCNFPVVDPRQENPLVDPRLENPVVYLKACQAYSGVVNRFLYEQFAYCPNTPPLSPVGERLVQRFTFYEL